MPINDIVDILIDPTTKSKLIVENNYLYNIEKTISYEFDAALIKLIPQSIKTNNYIEHYEKDGETYDYFHQDQDSKVTADDRYRLRQTVLSKINNLNNCSTVIDIGSGNGWAAQELVAHCGRFAAIDISERNLKTINSIINQNASIPNRDNFFAIQADAMNMPFANNSIDYIISCEVIEHLPDPKRFIDEAFRVLKPDGKIIISTPYKEKIRNDLCIHCNKLTPRNSHLHSFDSNNLLKLAADCPNSEVKFHTFGNKVLHFARCYVLLQFLPLKLWHFVDRLANLLINRRLHIIMTIKKQATG